MASNKVSEDPTKRAMLAIERRFGAELIQQQKSMNGFTEADRKESRSINPYVASSAIASVTYLSTPSKKDVKEDDPTYSKLSHAVHENLLTVNNKAMQVVGRKENKVDKIVHELLQKGDSAQKYTQGSKTKRIDNWILLDNYVQGRGVSTGSRIRALRMHSKRSKRHMSIKQHKKHGSFDLPLELLRYGSFMTMHEMWKSYMMQLLKNCGKNQLAQYLLDADLHGAIILVADCTTSAFTGVNGIMIRETAETFGIITQDDKFRVVPKRSSVFICQVDCWKITLHGDKLTSRNLGL